MLFKRKKKKEFHLTPEEARQVIQEHWEYARRFAEQGNVAGMEMALEASASALELEPDNPRFLNRYKKLQSAR